MKNLITKDLIRDKKERKNKNKCNPYTCTVSVEGCMYTVCVYVRASQQDQTLNNS